MISFEQHKAKADIIINGEPLPASVKLIALTLTDKRGLEPDSLTIELDDSADTLPLPEHKAVISLALGWNQDQLIDKGTFTVSAVTHSGAPDKITITAKSADLLTGFKDPKKRSWSNVTLWQWFYDIAQGYGLHAIMDAGLRKKTVEQIDQHDESDANLITRLANDYDAIAQVKAGFLIFMPKGKAVSATGKALDPAAIKRQLGDAHTFTKHAEQSSITGVKAYYYSLHQSTRPTVIAGKTGNTRHIKAAYPSQQTAQDAANAKWAQIQRGVHTFSANLARGMPELIVESPVTLSGYKAEIDQIKWVGKEIMHTLNESGLITSVQLEQLIE